MQNFDNIPECKEYVDSQPRELVCATFDNFYKQVFQEGVRKNLIVNVFYMTYTVVKKKKNCPTLKDDIFLLMDSKEEMQQDLSWIYIMLCNKEEAEAFLDNTLIGSENSKSMRDLESIINILQFILNGSNGLKKSVINTNKYKKKVAEMILEQVQLEINTPIYLGYPHLLDKILTCQKISKDLNEKNLLEKAKGVQEQLRCMMERGHNFPNSLNIHSTKEIRVYEEDISKLKNVFSQQLQTPKLLVNSIINGIQIDEQTRYTPFFKHHTHESKSISSIFKKNTAKGNIAGKPISEELSEFLFHRKVFASSTYKAICEVVFSANNYEEILNYILSSPVIFDEDKIHLERVFKLMKDNMFFEFIYMVIPNIEKLLRNVLLLNNIQPTVLKSNDNQTFQNIMNLSEVISCIEKNSFFDEELLFEVRSKLNDDRHENYRNRVSHKLDNEVFSNATAYDLFVLLINILFYKNREI